MSSQKFVLILWPSRTGRITLFRANLCTGPTYDDLVQAISKLRPFHRLPEEFQIKIVNTGYAISTDEDVRSLAIGEFLLLDFGNQRLPLTGTTYMLRLMLFLLVSVFIGCNMYLLRLLFR